MLDGVIACLEDGWFGRELADAAYEFQSKLAAGRWTMVGVNGYTDGDNQVPNTLYIDPKVEAEQLRALAALKRDRDDEAVRRALERLRVEAADPTVNLMPALIEAAAGHVTVGEAMAALEDVFGTWLERSFV
jgi:methylmalonyl-CoA mutase N-terminal domain/subunit